MCMWSSAMLMDGGHAPVPPASHALSGVCLDSHLVQWLYSMEMARAGQVWLSTPAWATHDGPEVQSDVMNCRAWDA